MGHAKKAPKSEIENKSFSVFLGLLSSQAQKEFIQCTNSRAKVNMVNKSKK